MNSIKITLLMLLLTGLSACTKNELEFVYDHPEEGESAQMQFTFEDGTMQTKGVGLTPGEEKTVSSVHVLIFDKNGNLITSKNYPSFDINVGILGIPTKSGTNMSIYAFANISPTNTNLPAGGTLFDNVKTVNDLNNIKVYNVGSDVELNKRLLMWGFKTGVTIPALPASSSVTIPLNYVASKIHVNLIDDTPVNEQVSWVDWKLQNFSKFSNLLPQSVDAVNPANSSDFLSSIATFAWVDTTFTVNGVQKSGKATVIYLFENRRGGRSSGSPADTNPRNKTQYAPPKATAIIANGYYRTSSQTRGITATIFLGNNNYNDYNLERMKEYTYQITVKGIDEIDIDSRVDATNAGFQADVLKTTLDCHYDWRPLRLGSFAGKLKVEVLDASGLLPSTWLKLSAINLNQFVNNGSGTYVRPTYLPADMVSTISDITFTDATQITFKNYYLYADEFMTEGGTRSAMVKVTSSLAGSIPISIPITQKGYQMMGTAVGLRKFSLLGAILPSDDYKLIVENQEEATMILTPGVSAGVEKTATMQWGFNTQDMQAVLPISLFDYYKRAGYDNTQNLVMSNITTATLRVPYGRTSSGTISEQAHNPIFNSYAARYCFEKNRDVNGDGKISGTEIKWYLPSLEELILIYIGEPSLSQILGEQMTSSAYQSSTEFTTTTDNMGILFGLGRTGTVTKPTAIYVRCVRAI